MPIRSPTETPSETSATAKLKEALKAFGPVNVGSFVHNSLIPYRDTLPLTRSVSLRTGGNAWRGWFPFEGELTSENQNPWQAIGGVALLWPAVRIVLGLGYGNYFIPGINIAMPDRTLVPDLSISVVL